MIINKSYISQTSKRLFELLEKINIRSNSDLERFVKPRSTSIKDSSTLDMVNIRRREIGDDESFISISQINKLYGQVIGIEISDQKNQTSLTIRCSDDLEGYTTAQYLSATDNDRYQKKELDSKNISDIVSEIKRLSELR